MEGPKCMSINTSDEYLDALLEAIEPIIYPNGPEKEAEPEDMPEPIMEPPVAEPVVSVESAIEQEAITMPMEESIAEEISSLSFDTQGEPSESADMDVSSLLGALSQEETVENNIETMENVEPEIDLSAFLTDDVDLEENGTASDNSSSGNDDDSATIGDLLAALTAEDDDIEELDTDTEDIDSLLSSVSGQPIEDNSASYNQDVKDLLGQFSEDEDLSDIQDMLDKNDNGEALDNSLLDVPSVEVFKVEEDGEDNEAAIKSGNIVEKMVNSLHRFFKRKKAEKEEAEQERNSVEEAEGTEVTEAEIAQAEELTDVSEISLFGDTSGDDTEELVLDEDMSDIEMLLSGGGLQNSGTDIDAADEAVDSKEADSGKGKKKSRKEKKEKKEGKDKKDSVFTKILNMLTEEIEEPKAKSGVPEAGETGITDENLGILKELSKEDKKKAKKEEKKNKKNGKKGGKKGDAEEADSKDGKGKKAKPKKDKKKREKKEKKEKPVVISKPEKKLPRKRVLSVFGLCFSILAAILILQGVVSKSDNIKDAKYAFDTADYETCFANLSGIERTEEEEALYQKSFVILSVQRKLDSYNNFMLMKREKEALNSLFEGVIAYREQEANAVEWGVQGQVMAIYEEIWNKLEAYGLSAEDVEEILAYESKVTYTKRLDSIVNGTPFDINDTMDGEVVLEPQPLEDVLPGEEDFLPEDTTDVTAGKVNTAEDAVLSEENEVEPYEEQHGQTVVVGSAPVDISGDTQEDFGGQNVGSGSTDVSVELNGNSVVVGGF